MPSKIIFSKEQISNIKDLASQGATRTEIAKKMNISRATIERVFKDYNIELIKTSNNQKGKKYEWTELKIKELISMYNSKEYNLLDISTHFKCSLKTITNKASDLKISKKESIEITKGDIEYFKNNYQIKTVEEMAKERRLNEYGVLKKLFKLGLSTKPPKYSNRNMPSTIDFWNDYINPNMSHTDVGRKHGIDRTTIGKWRRKDFGNDFKTMINTWLHKSEPELIFEDILNKLDMTFEYQKKILGWRCDYYLGFKTVVEINGRYWHSKEDAVIRDNKKKNELENEGYTLITIWDDELNDHEKIEQIIITQYRKAVMYNVPS